MKRLILALMMVIVIAGLGWAVSDPVPYPFWSKVPGHEVTGDLDVTGKLTCATCGSLLVPTYVISVSGSTYSAKKGATGEIETSGSSLKTVLETTFGNMANGQKIFFKNGLYMVDGKVSLPNTFSFTFECESVHGSKLFLANGVNDDMFEIADAGSSVNYFDTFANCAFWGNKANNSTSNGISIETSNANDLLFFNIYMEQFATNNIYIESAWDTRILSSVLEHAGNYNLYINSGADYRIVNTKFISPSDTGSGSGLYIGASKGSVINNFFYQHQRYGVYLDGSDAIFTGNVFFDNSQETDNAYDDVFVTVNGSDAIFGYNIFDGDTDVGNGSRYGINVSDATINNVNISHNYFQDYGTAPILNSGNNSLIRGNTGYPTDTIKSSNVVPVDTGGVYAGTYTYATKSKSGRYSSFNFIVTTTGVANPEVLTLELRIISEDNTQYTVDVPIATNADVTNYEIPKSYIYDLVTDGDSFRALRYQVKSDQVSTSATVTVKFYGRG